ncbi:MAG: leucine-rich repeat domain-containing protein [Clostridia bacterium]|nr:leucine-rich repeat domain-containing protein [Clostridia bacterium]
MKKFLSLFLALVMCLSLFACGKSSDGEETKKQSEKEEMKETEYEDTHGELAKEAEEKLPQYILEAIRAYYGLDFGAELTDKMVASVETLTIDIPGPYSDTEVYVDAAVNGSKFSGFAVRPSARVYPDRMASIHKLADEFYEKVANDPDTYTEKLAEYLAYVDSVEKWCEINILKFKAYSALIDINAEGLPEEDKAEILEKYPDIKETGPFYVYEEYMAPVEVERLIEFYVICTEAEVSVPMGEIDLSFLKVFPNLKSVKCDERFNAKNCPVKLEVLEVPYMYGHYKCGDNLTWKTENELLTITGNGDMWDFTEKGTPWVSEISSVVIENGVTSIGADAFNGQLIEELKIPDSVTKIGANAFANCRSLTEITIPDSVTKIGANALTNCRSLTEITIPDSVTEIGERAFYNCYNLETVVLPDSLTAISDLVFLACGSLKNVSIPASVTSIQLNAFFNCSNIDSFTVDSGNPNYCAIDGILFTKDKSELICYPCGKSSSTYTIPDGVTTIGSNAFNGAYILENVKIPNSVTSIEDYAFSNCTELTEFVIPGNVKSIGEFAFNSCNSIAKITISEGVEIIEDNAFAYCNSIRQLTIPGSVKAIGDDAFSACDNLEKITFEGTKSEWETLTTDNFGPVISDGVTVICSDGNI